MKEQKSPPPSVSGIPQAEPPEAPVVLDERHALGPSPLSVRVLQRQARLARKMVPPPGLVTADQIRAHWLGEVATFERWAESPLEHEQARDYRTRIEAATDDELRAQYAPYATPIAWQHASDIPGKANRVLTRPTDNSPATPYALCEARYNLCLGYRRDAGRGITPQVAPTCPWRSRENEN